MNLNIEPFFFLAGLLILCCSNFTEIFDVDWFISSLSKDVKIIKQLPEKGGKGVGKPYRMRVPRKCSARCYQNRVLPALMKKHVSANVRLLF